MAVIRSVSTNTNTSNPSQIWKDTVSYLPLVTVVLLGLSTWYVVMYYQTFNISILEFIPYTEFIKDVIVPVIVIGLILGIAVGFKTDDGYRSARRSFLYSLSAIAILILANIIYPDSLIVLLIMFHCLVLLISLASLITFQGTHQLYLITFLGLFIMIIVTVWSRFYAELLKENTPPLELSFIYKEKKFTTDSATIFIGSSEDYLFFYNKKDKSNLVLDRSETDSLIWKQRVNNVQWVAEVMLNKTNIK